MKYKACFSILALTAALSSAHAMMQGDGEGAQHPKGTPMGRKAGGASGTPGTPGTPGFDTPTRVGQLEKEGAFDAASPFTANLMMNEAARGIHRGRHTKSALRSAKLEVVTLKATLADMEARFASRSVDTQTAQAELDRLREEYHQTLDDKRVQLEAIRLELDTEKSSKAAAERKAGEAEGQLADETARRQRREEWCAKLEKELDEANDLLDTLETTKAEQSEKIEAYKAFIAKLEKVEEAERKAKAKKGSEEGSDDESEKEVKAPSEDPAEEGKPDEEEVASGDEIGEEGSSESEEWGLDGEG